MDKDSAANTGSKRTRSAALRRKQQVSAQEFVQADQTGNLLPRIKDDLVCFEARDLTRLESKLGRVRSAGSVRDYQNLACVFFGVFVALLIFLVSLYLTIDIPPRVEFFSLLATAVALLATIGLWLMSFKIKTIKGDLLGEVIDDIAYHRSKFARPSSD